METPDMSEENTETANPEGPSSTGDLSNGYCIHLYVTPKGFQVSEAEPISQEQEEGEHPDEGDTYPDLTTALKHIMAEVKANPLGDDSHAQFAAGYASGPGGQGMSANAEPGAGAS